MNKLIIISIVILIAAVSVYFLAFSVEPQIIEVHITPEDPQVGDTVTVNAKVQKSPLDVVRINLRYYHAKEGASGSGGGSKMMALNPSTGEYYYVFTNIKDGSDFFYKIGIGSFVSGILLESEEYSFNVNSQEVTGESNLSITNVYHLPENPKSGDFIEYRATIMSDLEIIFSGYTYEKIWGSSRGSGSGGMRLNNEGEYSSDPFGTKYRGMPLKPFESGSQITYWIVAKDTTGILVTSEKKTFTVS